MREEIEPIAEVAVDAIVKVHRALGPGLLESVYCTGAEARAAAAGARRDDALGEMPAE
jgi:hypothetical protein